MTVYLARFYRAKTAAEYLGISASKLRELEERGDLTAKEIDGCVVYDRYDLDAYADSRPYRDRERPKVNTCDGAFK